MEQKQYMNIKTEETIGIIGLGYVGLPLLINFGKSYKVLGFDSDEKKVEVINSGKSNIDHIPSSDIENLISNGPIATSDFAKIKLVDAIIICVPTPITVHREPDLSYVINVVNQIIPFLKSGQLISLESTTYPGTTEEVIGRKVQDAGHQIGKDIFITYSPEREDPGSKFKLQDIPKVIGGITNECLTKGSKLYSSVFNDVVQVNSVKVAELSKLLENIHRAVNLGMINEFKIICDAMSVDPFEVINAAATKPFGFVPYYPGPGWGGHCIPVDPFYLSWKAKEYGHSSRFIELAGELNLSTQSWVLSKISESLNIKNLSISQSKILVLGISYKPDVDDARESPALNIFSELYKNGADVDYSDPYFSELPHTRKFNIEKKGIDLTPSNISSYDAVILLTNHTKYDYDLIYQNANLIIDTRGVYDVDNIKVIRA
jgi:UDP-N-acetyl-D-glucosamine dehydrogenase